MKKRSPRYLAVGCFSAFVLGNTFVALACWTNPVQFSSCPIYQIFCYAFGDPVPVSQWNNATNYCRWRCGGQAQWANKPPTMWLWCIYLVNRNSV